MRRDGERTLVVLASVIVTSIASRALMCTYIMEEFCFCQTQAIARRIRGLKKGVWTKSADWNTLVLIVEQINKVRRTVMMSHGLQRRSDSKLLFHAKLTRVADHVLLQSTINLFGVCIFISEPKHYSGSRTNLLPISSACLYATSYRQHLPIRTHCI